MKKLTLILGIILSVNIASAQYVKNREYKAMGILVAGFTINESYKYVPEVQTMTKEQQYTLTATTYLVSAGVSALVAFVPKKKKNKRRNFTLKF